MSYEINGYTVGAYEMGGYEVGDDAPNLSTLASQAIAAYGASRAPAPRTTIVQAPSSAPIAVKSGYSPFTWAILGLAVLGVVAGGSYLIHKKVRRNPGRSRRMSKRRVRRSRRRARR